MFVESLECGTPRTATIGTEIISYRYIFGISAAKGRQMGHVLDHLVLLEVRVDKRGALFAMKWNTLRTKNTGVTKVADVYL